MWTISKLMSIFEVVVSIKGGIERRQIIERNNRCDVRISHARRKWCMEGMLSPWILPGAVL
jgi:hypothetical protein